jgi:plasmid stabilization system protein ParE
VTRYTFHESAELELIDAAQYYESRSDGLGRMFLAEVDAAIADVLKYPKAAPVVHGEARRKPVRRFPYALLYAVEDESVRFLAVGHNRRRPLYWSDRL